MTDKRKAADGLGDHDAIAALLRELRTAKSRRRRDEIYVELGEERLVHQGMVSSAAPSAVAPLIELVAARPDDRVDLLMLLARIAVGSPELHWTGDSRDEPGPRDLSSNSAPPLLVRAYREVARHKSTYLDLLGDRKAITRTAAALLLAFFAPEPSSLDDRLATEKNDQARFALHIAQYCWTSFFSFESRVSAREKTKLATLGRAIAIVRTHLRDGKAVLQRAIASAPALSPSLPIDVRAVAMTALEAVDPDAAIEPATAAIKKGELSSGDLLGLAFAAPVDEPAVPALLPAFEDLTPRQQRIVKAIAGALPKDESTWLSRSWAFATGLPSARQDLARYTGAERRGPLEAAVRGEVKGVAATLPVHGWLRRLALGVVSRKQVVASFAAHLPAADIVGAFVLATDDAYDLMYTADFDWHALIALGCDVLAARNDTRDALERAARRAYLDPWAGAIVLPALDRFYEREGAAMPARYDKHVRQACDNMPPSSEHVRTVLRRLPAKRRDAILFDLSLPDSDDAQPTVWDRPIGPRLEGWYYVDLAADRPVAASRIASAVASWKRVGADRYQPRGEAIAILVAYGDHAIPPIDANLPSATPTGRDVLREARARIGSP